MALIPCLVTSDEELMHIMQLQQQNLKQHFTEEEKNAQGFLTIHHSLDVLQKMNALAPSVIIKDNDKVVAFALTEVKECRQLVPSLESMFAVIEQCSWKEKPISDYSYYTMGQICVAKEYRGQGLFEQLYLHHKKIYQQQFDLFITEISTSNFRSQRAHQKMGFKSIYTHRDQLDEWTLVVWDWS